SQILHDAGYNIVRPLRTEHRNERQIALYPLVKLPVVFDLVRNAENTRANSTSKSTPLSVQDSLKEVLRAEQQECKKLFEIYQNTAQKSTAAENDSAPIHQLFWRRLTAGRFNSFYKNSETAVLFDVCDSLSSDVILTFEELLEMRWKINDIEQQRTLQQLLL